MPSEREVVLDRTSNGRSVKKVEKPPLRKLLTGYANPMQYFVYIISNVANTSVYVGVTNNLERRIYEHKNKVNDGFTKKYNVTKLVYFEETNSINSAIEREKQIKKWSRTKKDELINSINPTWKDLSVGWYSSYDS